jgi:hypothetical protein
MLKNYRIVCKILGNTSPKFFHRFTIYLRGAFGYALKSSSCRFNPDTPCLKCKLKFSCPFILIFKPPRKLFHGRFLMQKIKYVPRPYVFTPALKINTDKLCFYLRIYGGILHFEPIIIRAIKGLEERSFLNGSIKLKVERIEAVNELKELNLTLFTDEKGFIESSTEKAVILSEDIKSWAKEHARLPNFQLQVNLASPTKILRDGKNIFETKDVKLSDFVRYLARRRSLLSYFYLGKIFYDVKDVRKLMKWSDENTAATIQDLKKTNISIKRSAKFYIGKILFNFKNAGTEAEEILDLMKFGEYMGVGEMTAFGMGQYNLKIVER